MTDILESKAMLGPVVALVTWTLVVMMWLYAARIPALKRAGISLDGLIGSRPGGLDGVVEDKAQWKAHNYNHLTEQPTLFYAIAISLILLGQGGGVALWLAWTYVALRVLHSLVQITVNVVKWRFLIFTFASLCLMGMTLRAILVLGAP